LGGSHIAILFTAVIDMALALPGLILALVIAGLLGASLQSLVIGLVMASWPWWARLTRGLTLSAWEKEYVLAGRVVGISVSRLILYYILPQLKAPLLAAAALKTGWIILAFAGLSYLGLGPAPPEPEWGRMLQEAGIYMTQAPWLMLAPGAAVTLTVLALNLLGEAVEQKETL
jgi:ABC-type dipeptide/oligopeptide/nickel transport system permease subunit